MKKQFYTTSTSSLASLSAVAYGSSLFFREVKTQIIKNSLYKELYRSRPSSIFYSDFDFFFKAFSLLDFDYRPYYPDLETLVDKFIQEFTFTLDSYSFYDLSVKTAIEISLLRANLPVDISKPLLHHLSQDVIKYHNFLDFYQVVSNNHNSKINDVPDNSILELEENTLNLDKDSNDLERVHTTISPQDYLNNKVYRLDSTLNSSEKLAMNYFKYLPQQINSPEVYNGLRSVSVPKKEPDTSISLVNVKKGLYI